MFKIISRLSVLIGLFAPSTPNTRWWTFQCTSWGYR